MIQKRNIYLLISYMTSILEMFLIVKFSEHKFFNLYKTIQIWTGNKSQSDFNKFCMVFATKNYLLISIWMIPLYDKNLKNTKGNCPLNAISWSFDFFPRVKYCNLYFETHSEIFFAYIDSSLCTHIVYWNLKTY